MADAAAKKKEEAKPEDNGDKYAEFDVNIHGRPYRQVDGRIKEWRDELKAAKKSSEVIVKEAFWETDGVLVCQVRCYCPLNGYGEATAAAYGKNPIDKSNPYENAETSAWGRLLGLWGYGLLGGGMASAEEVVDAQRRQGGAVESEAPPTSTSKPEADRKEVMMMLAEMSEDRFGEEAALPDGRYLHINRDRFSDLLEEATQFTNKDGELVAGRRDLKKVSDKAIGPTKHKVQKMYKDWLPADPVGEGDV